MTRYRQKSVHHGVSQTVTWVSRGKFSSLTEASSCRSVARSFDISAWLQTEDIMTLNNYDYYDKKVIRWKWSVAMERVHDQIRSKVWNLGPGCWYFPVRTFPSARTYVHTSLRTTLQVALNPISLNTWFPFNQSSPVICFFIYFAAIN